MIRLLALVMLASIAGCQPTVNPDLAAAGAPTPAAPGAPVISNLDIPTHAIAGAEEFEGSFDVNAAGSGLLAQYGLSSRLGSQLYPIKPPTPVIDHGHVKMTTIGPLPDLTQAGDLDCEFWVVDSNGKESNHLAFKMKVQ